MTRKKIKLSSTLVFGGKTDPSLGKTTKNIGAKIDRIGGVIAKTTKRQKALSLEISKLRRQGKSVDSLARSYKRLEERSRKLERAQRRLRAASQFNLKNAGLAAGGLAAGGLAAGRRASQLAGTATADQGLALFVDFEQGLTRLSNQAKLTAVQTKVLKESILKTSSATLVGATELLAGVDKAQEKFSDPGIVTDNLTLLAKTSNALNASFPDTVNAIGQFVQNMGIAKDEIPRLVGAMEQAQESGAITVADIATTFAQSIGTFASATQQRGQKGARNLLATAQVLGKSGAGREKTQVQLEALLADLVTPSVRKKLARRVDDKGLKNRLRKGGEVDIASLFSELASDKRIGAIEIAKLFGTKRSRRAATTIIEQTRAARGRGEQDPLKNIAKVGAQAGLDVISKTSKELISGPAGQLIKARVDSENRYIKNSENLAKTAAGLGGKMAELSGEFPLLSEAAKVASASLLAVGATGLLGGKGGALGKVFGSLGKAGAGLGVLGGFAAAGAGGLAFGTFLEKQFDLSNKINNLLGKQVGGDEAAPRGIGTVNANVTVNAAPGQNVEAIGQAVVQEMLLRQERAAGNAFVPG